MSGGYQSVTEGAILVGTIAAWNWPLDVLSYRIPEELHEKLREQGIDRLSKVKAAFLEADGRISVIRRASGDAPPHAAEVTPDAR